MVFHGGGDRHICDMCVSLDGGRAHVGPSPPSHVSQLDQVVVHVDNIGSCKEKNPHMLHKIQDTRAPFRFIGWGGGAHVAHVAPALCLDLDSVSSEGICRRGSP